MSEKNPAPKSNKALATLWGTFTTLVEASYDAAVSSAHQEIANRAYDVNPKRDVKK